MSLTPGDLGIDYSYGRPNLKAAVAAGARFVLRYSAGAASATSHPSHGANAGKLITPAEFRAIIAAGLDIIANDEWYETRITEGAAAGRQDGAASGALWRSCGLGKGSSIYVSWDAAVNSAKFAAVAAYLDAFDTALGGYYYVDMYGGTPAIRAMLAAKRIRYGWRPNAGSWSADGLPYQPDVSSTAKRAALVAEAVKATPAHIWQTGNYWFSKTADENMIVRVPVGSHRESLTPPTPSPSPTPVPAATRSNRAMMYRVLNPPAGTTSNCFLMRDSRIDLIAEGATCLAFANALGQNVGTDLAKLPGCTYQRHLALGGPSLPIAQPADAPHIAAADLAFAPDE